MPQSHLKTLFQDAPKAPGIYKFLSLQGQILYIGKAKNIYKRLQNYFSENILPHTKEMVRKANTIEWHQTDTEAEALFLEAELIEKQKPFYNIQYKYGKNYTYLTLSQHEFPRIFYQHTWSEKSYGPFASGDNTRQIIDGLAYAFKIRTCSNAIFHSRKRPCMEYDIGRCSAPCMTAQGKQEYINSVTYQESVSAIKHILSGHSVKFVEQWKKDLEHAVIEEKYELADILHKRIRAFETLKQFLPITDLEIEHADIFIGIENALQKCVYICGIRESMLRHKIVKITKIHEPMDTFIMRWYASHKNNLPPLLLSNEKLESATIKALKQKDITYKPYNAKLYNIHTIIQSLKKQGKELLQKEKAEKDQLKSFAQELGLENIGRVEVYDNSHMSGKWNLGVRIVWSIDGFDKTSYQVYKYPKHTNDDYEMMRAMFGKRFGTGSSKTIGNITLLKQEKNIPPPSLVIIDGGAGQLSVSSPFIPTPHFAISKHEDRDRLHGKNGIIHISQACLYWLMKLRDEAHRYAIQQHRILKIEGLLDI